MSRAYDTIRRDTVLNLLEDAGCTSDDIRLVAFLLRDTSLKIKINKNESIPFLTTLGSAQGDSLSGKLFSLYLAGALNHLRVINKRANPLIERNLLPLEMEYVDDTDFIDENMENLTEMIPQIESIFGEWNLKVNPNKTEYTEIYISDDKSERGKEEWRNSKVLGSKLCSINDIKHRINLGNVAFNNFKKLWSDSKTISEKDKIKLYEVMVVPVKMYNSCTWAAPQKVIEKLDISQRNHLKQLVKSLHL